MRVVIVYNPTAGSADQPFLELLRDKLTAANALVVMYPTQCAGDAQQYLAASGSHFDVVLAAGGDGTVNEVVNGMQNIPNHAWRLGIIPLGTTNVLARELGIKKNIQLITNMVLNANEKTIFPARLNGRRFMLMAGVGFDAWVVNNVDLKLKKRAGKLAYILSIVKQIRHFGSKQYRLQIDGTDFTVRSSIITNGKLYGGSFVISRKADLSAATTQVLMLKGKSPLGLLGSLLGLPFGLLEKMPGIESVAARDIKIELMDDDNAQEPVQADGDVIGHLPVHIQMEEKPLRVLVPCKSN